ncbi:MAG: ParB/RepB/Spo0J family partition protein [Thermomicrobiales bacterium]|nr:ParB/RepB/Spo0J family partition protein [Thermomicrobiales bacterium]
MTTRRGGLGRGLESLIPGIGQDEASGGAITVDVGTLEPNPVQPRVRWDSEQLESLAASIREHGIIQPIVVTRAAGGSTPYQIVAGERRWRAAQMAGLRSVPVIVREATPAQLLELALVENVQRADLNPIEEALAYRQLTTEFGLTQSAVAERVGKSRPAIANSIRLLSAPESIQEAVANEQISAGHAKALLAVDDPMTLEHLLRQVISGDLSVRETERLVQRTADAPRRTRPTASHAADPAVRAVESSLRRALGTRVELARRGETGRIVISFNSDEELNAILERIVGVEEEL